MPGHKFSTSAGHKLHITFPGSVNECITCMSFRGACTPKIV